MRSAEAPNLKAALKKIIREAATGGEDTEEAEVSVGQDVSVLGGCGRGEGLTRAGPEISRL
jgi:hypothetical protein